MEPESRRHGFHRTEKTVESEAALGKGVLDEKRFSPAMYYLSIEGFRGIKALSWHAAVSVVLGSGDVGKTTILDAIGLLLNPSNTDL